MPLVVSGNELFSIHSVQHELTNRRFIEKRGVGYTVRCPAGCDGSEVTESHHFRLMGKDMVRAHTHPHTPTPPHTHTRACTRTHTRTHTQYDRYQKFGTEEFILQMGGVLCPRPGCGMGLLPDDMGRRVQCPRGIGGCGVRESGVRV